MQRESGLLVHPTSFPSPYGIGDLGEGAYEFIDFMYAAKQQLWQVLPLGPTGYGDSPYQSFSTFAGNHYLISPKLMCEEGYLTPEDIEHIPDFDPKAVDYGPVIEYKMGLYRTAFGRFKAKAPPKAYAKFCRDNKKWLNDYTLFVALKDYFIKKRKNDMDIPEEEADCYYGASWNTWPKDIAKRTKKTMEEYQALLSEEIEFHRFLQYEFFREWDALRTYAHKKGIKIIGDVPIFVAMDSSDVWAAPGLFQLDEENIPKVVAGVPPDYFSETGQLWGNPLYDWAVHKKQDYAWWVDRMSTLLNIVDIVRIDHFRGFESYWAVPYGQSTAEKGKWVKGPGKAVFTAMAKKLGSLPIIAEDLGIITDKVRAMRDSLGLPGMAVLQFAFSHDAKNLYLPHNFVTANMALYTGTHDNDTTAGWYKAASNKEKDYYRRYMNVSGEDVAWDLIRLAWSSCARYAIAPIQDIFSMGNWARMNTPGEPVGNWCFRYQADMLNEELADRLVYLAKLFNRLPEEEV